MIRVHAVLSLHSPRCGRVVQRVRVPGLYQKSPGCRAFPRLRIGTDDGPSETIAAEPNHH